MCKKKGYNTKEEAIKCCEYAIKQNWIPNLNWEYYLCMECDLWHFGSPSEPKTKFNDI